MTGNASQMYIQANFGDDTEHLQSDVTEIPADAIGDHDILTAGFPCQVPRGTWGQYSEVQFVEMGLSVSVKGLWDVPRWSCNNQHIPIDLTLEAYNV